MTSSAMRLASRPTRVASGCTLPWKRLKTTGRGFSVAVEAPGTALLYDDLEARLVVAVQQDVADPASRILIGQLQRIRAEPLGGDDRHLRVRQDAAEGWLPADRPHRPRTQSPPCAGNS